MKRFRPSNSTDGMAFERDWCEKCIRHPKSLDAKKQCTHLAKAFFGEDNKKWFWKDGEPVCLAFRDRADIRSKRLKVDKNQLSLF